MLTFFDATMLFMTFAHPSEVRVLAHRAPIVAWAAHTAVVAEGSLFRGPTAVDDTTMLLIRIAYLESRGDPAAENARGDVGIAQLQPQWFAGHTRAAIKRDPVLGFRLAIRALRSMQATCGGPAQRWLGAYASGVCGGAPITARRRCAPVGLCHAT